MGKTLFGPSVGELKYISEFHRSVDSNDFALATTAPGKMPSVSFLDINTFNALSGPAHEQFLRSSAK